ncbi:MAG: DUF4282 domain-containing protein, partial [Actinomycetia bacterium]|nr:DUF4282 domain-containing protein [Actinomycetes bacterium]
PGGPGGSGGPGFGTSPQDAAKGFFGALFDFGFNHFVTPKIVKIVYILLTVLTVLSAIFSLVGALASGEAGMIIIGLFIIPLVAIMFLALIRMSLEMYYAVIRLSEDVHHGRGRW